MQVQQTRSPPVNSRRYNDESRPFFLEIGGQVIRVRSCHAGLINTARRIYPDFWSHPENFDFNIDVHIAADLHLPNPDGTTNFFNEQFFGDGHCFVNSNYFTGDIDLERNNAVAVFDRKDYSSWLEHFL